jgi:DNA-binding CsgD family transcriptional regulator
MTGRMTVSELDLRVLAGMVTEHRDDIPAQGLPASLLADLMSQIRCDVIMLEGLDSEHEATWLGQAFPAGATALDETLEPLLWQHYWDCEPCSYPEHTGDLRSVIAITDFYSARQWHGTGMYSDLYRPFGFEHELKLILPAGPARPGGKPGTGRTLRLFLFRGPGSDFSEADRALLTLLRPHLHQAYLDAEHRRRDPGPTLTSRQRQLLDLVASGHTNAQIARRLGIAEGTVRKHLENIHRRLQVSSRTAAVIRALAHPDYQRPVTGPDSTPAPARRDR